MRTERPLTAQERDSLLARRVALEGQIGLEIAADKRVSRGAGLATLPFVLLFAAICIYSLRVGAHGGAIAAGAAALIFSALAVWMARWDAPGKSWQRQEDEIWRIDHSLKADSAFVYDLVADAALVVSLRKGDGEPIGDLLRMGSEIIYVRRSTSQLAPAEQLPNRHLRLIDVGAYGVISAVALGERVEPAIPVVVSDEDDVLDLVVDELIESERDFDELARELAGIPLGSPYR